MIKISKDLRDWLVNEKNVPCGENGVSKTHSHYITYYLCTSRHNMNLVKEYEKMIGLSK